MRKIFPIIICILFYQSAITQEYTAFDGTLFKVGDSINIGDPSGVTKYKHLKSFDSKSSVGYSPTVPSFVQGNKYIIKKFHINDKKFNKAFYSNNSVVVEYGTKGLWGISMYAELNLAIQSGEIALKYSPINAPKKAQLTDSVALVYYYKSANVSNEKLQEEYLYRFLPALFKRSKNDEFEYQNSLGIAKNNLEKLSHKLDTATEFEMYSKFKIGNYNFEQLGFPIDENELNIIMLKQVNSILSNSKADYLPLVTVFENFDSFKFLEVDKVIANTLIKRKKDKYGKIDRNLYARITYKISTENYNEEIKNFSNEYRYIIGIITSIEFYEFDNFKYNWIGEIKWLDK